MAKKIIKRTKKESQPANVIPMALGNRHPMIPVDKSSHDIRKIPANKKLKPSVVKNWIPTEEQRHLVSFLSAYGHTPEEIAMVCHPDGPISYSTIIRLFGQELKYGKVKHKAWLAMQLHEKILDPRGGIVAMGVWKELYGSASSERRQSANMGYQKSEDEETYFEKVGKEIGGMVDTLPKTPKKVENE